MNKTPFEKGINMAENSKSIDEPEPCQAFDHAVTKMTMEKVDSYSPGFEESNDVLQNLDKDDEKSRDIHLPPRNPEKIPRTSLAERILKRITRTEETK